MSRSEFMLRAYVLSLPMAFLLKIAVPPFLVAAMSLAARWWGPTIGGLLLGMPWMTGPVLFFLALDKGEDFAVGACAGIELGVVCVAAFMVAYGPCPASRAGRQASLPLPLRSQRAPSRSATWRSRSPRLRLGRLPV